MAMGAPVRVDESVEVGFYLHWGTPLAEPSGTKKQ
jgi:hypothetical protein